MHKVKCSKCGQYFDRDKIPFIPDGRRYSHQVCPEIIEQTIEEKKIKPKKTKEQMTERESLIDFIYVHIYHKVNYEGAKISLLIDRYKEKYNFTYSGMEKTLEWLEKNGFAMEPSIMSLLPYKYEEVFNLYKSIYEIQDINIQKMENYVANKINVSISAPARSKEQVLPLFNMEDDE